MRSKPSSTRAISRFRWFVCDADSKTSSSSASSRPANRERPSRRRSHRSAAVRPGIRLVVAIAPALTIGLVRPSALCSTAATELNGRPVAFTPMRSRASSTPADSQTSAKTNGFATLMIVKPASTSPTP